MKKIAVIHPQFIEGGGSESTPLWMVEALLRHYEVYLITMDEVDLNKLNNCYGTNLKTNQFKTISIPIPNIFKRHFDALKHYRLSRFCKKGSSKFDLMISTYNIMDFGKRGIQYIADFSFDDNLRRIYDSEHPGFKSLLYKKSLLRRLYLKLGKYLAGSSKDGWKENLTVANSKWSSKIMRDIYGIQAPTIYHPVVGKFPNIPWEKRENGVVVLARISPEKQIERIIKILERIRRKGWDIHLHILGRTFDSEYAENIKQLCEKNQNWAFMEGTIFGDEKLKFLAKHKFGISGRQNEPFGIAVAEMAKAGCIVWVPKGGGQTEIVNHSLLIYNNIEDAVNKIEKVLKDITLQAEIRKHLANQSENFSTERFKLEIKNIVGQFFSKK